LFLISFEHYIALSFSVFGNKKVERTIRILMQGVQLVTFFTLLIPLLLFNINIIHYETLNVFAMSLNLLSVVVFIAAFFFMNFKMTGLMMDKRST
jgi:glucan phosphoethanolaminetransferase (alkaline phosphatase superfamily)